MIETKSFSIIIIIIARQIYLCKTFNLKSNRPHGVLGFLGFWGFGVLNNCFTCMPRHS